MMQPESATPASHVSQWKSLWEQQKAPKEADLKSEKYGHLVPPKVLIWAREHCHDTPYFVKPICATALSQFNRSPSLRIPGPFIRVHFRELQQEVTLQNGDGKAWKVSFRCAEKYPNWKAGWRAFSKDHNLQVGDNIVFALVDKSQFLFTVFDKHGIMKKNFAPEIKNHHIPKSSKTPSTDKEDDCDVHWSLRALAIKSKHSRTSAASAELKVEENAESEVRVVESSEIEEAEEEEEAGLKVLNPPIEEEHDGRGVYNQYSELGKDRRHVSSKILEHPYKLRPVMSIKSQAERGATTGRNTMKTHLKEQSGTFFHEIPAIGCDMGVQDRDNYVGDHGQKPEAPSDDIVMKSLGRKSGNYGDMEYPGHRAGHREVVVERRRPVTRSAAVKQQLLPGQQPAQKVKRARVDLGFSERSKPHTAEAKEDDQSNRDQSNFVHQGLFQVPKSNLDWNQEISPLSHYFRSKRRIPTPLERHGAAEAAETYALALRAPNFVTTMAESQVYIDFQLVIPQTFARESSLPAAGTALTLVNCTGESWEVRSHSSFLTSSDFVMAFHRRDWCLFAVHHFLEEGDVCVFELTDPECLTILVRIFRVVDIPKLRGQRCTVENHYNIQETGFGNPNLESTSALC